MYIAFDVGTPKPGASIVLSYYTALDAGAIGDILAGLQRKGNARAIPQRGRLDLRSPLGIATRRRTEHIYIAPKGQYISISHARPDPQRTQRQDPDACQQQQHRDFPP